MNQLFSRPALPRRTWLAPRLAARLRFTGLALAGLSMGMSLGCRGDGGGPVGPSPVIAGNWSGTARLRTVGFEATFTQTGQSVGGTGHFSSPLASGDFTVTGTLIGTRVDLVLTSAELGETVFRGRFTAADRIEGTLDPSGRFETDLTLDRD